MKKNRCVIVSAGPVQLQMKTWLRPETDYIIACDAGLRNCEKLCVTPDLVIGDFDSAPNPGQGNIIVLPHEKDDTDTHYAAKAAIREGYAEVLMLGALGGARLEHMLANLATGLWLEKQGANVVIADEKSRITFLKPHSTRCYTGDKYFYFSLFPAEKSADDICIKGAAYPLNHAVLNADYPLGISNEYRDKAAEISVGSGFLMVVETIRDL